MNTPEQESSLLILEECIQHEYSMRENLRPRVGSFVRMPARTLRHFVEHHNWAAINVCAHNLKEGSSFNPHLFSSRVERTIAMKKFFQFLLCLALAATSLGAQKTAAVELPPLIDRELIFGNPEIVNAVLSPDGKYLAFQKPWHDTRNIYVKGVDEPFNAARLLTTETKRPVPGYFWTRNSEYILYVKDNDGDENFKIYAVDPAAKPAAGAEAPPSRDLTGLKGVRVAIYDLPKSDPDVIYIGLNDRDKAWHDLYKLKLSTGEKAA